MSKMLNIGYAVEVITGRLNGSSAQVEKNTSAFKNRSYTKKIGGRGMISAICQKYNIRKFLEEQLGEEDCKRIKKGDVVTNVGNPYQILQDDVFGHMLASTITITEEEYQKLDETSKKMYTKKGKNYACNITKKRTARLQMSPLVNVSNRNITTEFNQVTAVVGNSIFAQEIYSGIMSAIANFNIENVGQFIVSDDATEFRDYDTKEAKLLGVRDLTKEQRAERIEKTLKALEFMTIKGNQTNYLTDTKPKFVILGEYAWGNNVFQGIVGQDGIDINMLKESLLQNEEHRISPIWIGINSFFDKEFNVDIENLKKELSDFNSINIDTVHNTFKNYVEYMKRNL